MQYLPDAVGLHSKASIASQSKARSTTKADYGSAARIMAAKISCCTRRGKA